MGEVGLEGRGDSRRMGKTGEGEHGRKKMSKGTGGGAVHGGREGSLRRAGMEGKRTGARGDLPPHLPSPPSVLPHISTTPHRGINEPDDLCNQ